MHCLIYTVKNDKRHLENLSKSLRLVHENLIPFTKDLEILFFHDPDTQKDIQVMTSFWNIKNVMFLIPFTTTAPAWCDKTDPWLKYKNMCRFWAGEVFRQPRVLEYDYYMRLDCDSFITEPLGYDPFEMMAREDKDYAFTKGGKFMDTAPYFEGINKALFEFEAQYYDHVDLSGNSILKNVVGKLQEGLLYYTNFEICRVRAFSDSLYMNLFDHIERVGGIYRHRWGDHIIRYAGIHMLIGFDRVKEITDMKYTHQGFVNGVIGG